MSGKGKPKDKKNDANIELEKKYDQTRIELIDKQILSKKLQEINSHLALENHELKEELATLKKTTSTEIQKLNLGIDSFKSRISELTILKNTLQIENATLKARLEHQEKEHQETRKQRDKELDEYKRHVSSQLTKYQNQVSDYNIAINERLVLISEKEYLMKTMNKEKDQFRKNLADKDRDKIQALDQLKKEMMDKFKDMKISLLSIRREQLDSNTRLTMLQNNQLIEELEYQSSNAAKIVARNLELQKMLKEKENQLIIQKEIEMELMKRTVISKKVLQTYHTKNTQLERMLNQQNTSNSKDIQPQNEHHPHKAKPDSNHKEALDKAYHHIQRLEKDICRYKAEISEKAKRFEGVSKEGTKLAILMCKYFEQILNGNHKSKELFNFTNLRNLQVEKWSPHSIAVTIKMLIDVLRPHIDMKNFDLEHWRRIIDTKMEQNEENQKHDDEDRTKMQKLKSMSLEKTKKYYQSKRKLSAQPNNDNLSKTVSNYQIRRGKVVQAQLRQWGQQIDYNGNTNILQRFKKPLKKSIR